MLTLDLSSSCEFEGEISMLFNDICYNNRENFNNLIEDLTLSHNSNIFLLVSNPLSRNTLNSNLFLDYCKIQLVKKLVSNNKIIDKIIIDSQALKNVLIQLPELNNTIFTIKERKIKRFTLDTILMVISPLTNFLKYFYRLFIFKIFINNKIKTPDYPIILIDTYALPGYYSKDRYYNGLWQSLKDEEKKTIYFVPTIVMTKWGKMLSVFIELLNSEKQFLFKESYLKLSDVLFSVLYPIRSLFPKIKHLMIDGIDYSSLVNIELRSRVGQNLAIEGLINYRFVKRLKEKKIKIKKVIDWWENQALDKGLHRALKDYYPNVSVVGYLGYAPRNLELQLFPTKFELVNGVVPENIAVIGKGFVDGLKIFNPDQKVDYAPAFRFQHLWNGGPHEPDKDTYTILIALPITFDDSVHIIDQMIACTNKISMNTTRFWIKPHPTMSAERLKRKFGNRWLQSLHFTELDTKVALRKSDILLSGMSSICLESMALGVPVLVVDRPQGLQYNPIPDEVEQDLWKQCNSVKNILDGINQYKKRDEEEIARHHQLGLQIRAKYFEPVTRVGVLKILGIEGDSTFAES